MSAFINYLKATKGELRHVNWPTRRQAVDFTLLVIGISLAVSLILGLLDFVFSQLLQRLVDTWWF